MTKALPQLSDKRLSNLRLLVVRLKLLALLDAGVSADGADVDHAVAELDKGAPLDGDVEIGDVVEAEVGKLLVLVLADPADEVVGVEGLAQLEGRESVLGEAEVEEGGDGDAGGLAELFLLLLEVGATDEADGALLAEAAQELEDLGGSGLGAGRREISLVADARSKEVRSTSRAGVRVPSTSKRQMVSLSGRSSRGG